MSSDAQTAYALALAFDLLADDRSATRAGDRLAELVRERGHRIATGFVGTPLICDALVRDRCTSTPPTALLLQTECPSWLYPVHDGRDHDLGALGQHAARRHASTPAR